MAIQTSSISLDSMKIRWEEPYVSEGLDRKMGALPRGVYRGSQAGESATPDKSFRLGPDVLGTGLFADNLWVYHDRTNGFSVTVRDTTIYTFDMSARFTDAGGTEIPAGGETWWVWGDVTYAVSSQTVGAINVDLSDPRVGDPDAVVFCKIDMPGGATTVLNSYFDYTVQDTPEPTKREYDTDFEAADTFHGLLSSLEAYRVPTLAEKHGLDAAPTTPSTSNPFVTKADIVDKYIGDPSYMPQNGLVSASKFQLTGVFYVGNAAGSGLATPYFTIIPATTKQITPILDSSNDNQPYVVKNVYKEDDSGPLNPSVDADSEGFYANPWIYLGLPTGASATYTGNLQVLCYEKKTLGTMEQAPASGLPTVGLIPEIPTSSVVGRDNDDDPDSLSQDTLDGQLAELLSYINNRIRTKSSGESTTEWNLLWRSKDILDSSIDEDTISCYFCNDNFAIVFGGYILTTSYPACQVYTHGSVSTDIKIFIFRNDGASASFYHVRRGVTGGPYDVDTPSDWDRSVVFYDIASSETIGVRGGLTVSPVSDGGYKALRIGGDGTPPSSPVDGDIYRTTEEAYAKLDGTVRMLGAVKAYAHVTTGGTDTATGYNVNGTVTYTSGPPNDAVVTFSNSFEDRDSVTAVAVINEISGNPAFVRCGIENAGPSTKLTLRVYQESGGSFSPISLDGITVHISVIVCGRLDV